MIFSTCDAERTTPSAEAAATLLGKEGNWEKRIMYKRRETDIHNLPGKKTFRRLLRSNLTPAEAGLWRILKSSKLDGRKFRRQHSVGSYILDFYCPSEKLAVELDGHVHIGAAAHEYDRARTEYLAEKGIRLIRIENRYVFEDPEWVVDFIRGSFI